MSELLSPECAGLLGYVALGAAVGLLTVVVVRMRTQHHYHDRENKELDARRRIRDRDSGIADLAADELLAIGERRQSAALVRAELKLLLLALSLACAALAWSWVYHV